MNAQRRSLMPGGGPGNAEVHKKLILRPRRQSRGVSGDVFLRRGRGHERRDAGPRRPPRGALSILLIAFVPLTFSEELAKLVFELIRAQWEPWVLAAVDGAFLALLLVLSWWHARRACGWRFGWLPYLLGSAVTLLLDWGTEYWRWAATPWRAFGTCFPYVLALGLILAAIVGVSPRALVSRKRRELQPTPWLRFRGGLPLLLGTLAAYLASVVWDGLAMAAAERAKDEPEKCVGLIDQQYFAQLSQIILLLLVVVGIEARIFVRQLDEVVQRATAIVTVALLCLGEALAIGALVRSNKECGELLHPWYEYFAFVITVEACVIALATLVWALLSVTASAVERRSSR